MLFGIAVAVNAYSTAAVTSGLNVSIVDPPDALLAYERYPITIVAGNTVTTTIPIKLHNRLPDSVDIQSLSVTSTPRIQVHSFTPTTLSASEEAFVSVTYVADALGGQYPVTHKLVASSAGADVELTFDIDFTVLNKLTVTATPQDAGTVQGGGTYSHNATAVVTATPNTCYGFERWSGDVPATQATDNPLSLTMDTNKELIAVFARQQYELTVDASEGGSVDPSGSNVYDCGSTVTITATPNSGYRFSGWDGDIVGEAQTTLSVYRDIQGKALFEPLVDADAATTSAETPSVEENQGD